MSDFLFPTKLKAFFLCVFDPRDYAALVQKCLPLHGFKPISSEGWNAAPVLGLASVFASGDSSPGAVPTAARLTCQDIDPALVDNILTCNASPKICESFLRGIFRDNDDAENITVFGNLDFICRVADVIAHLCGIEDLRGVTHVLGDSLASITINVKDGKLDAVPGQEFAAFDIRTWGNSHA